MSAAVALLLAASVVDPGPPSGQALIFYNARVALREGKPSEALKLWLLRNALAKVEGHVGRHDAELRSNTWAALGSLGLCGDGFSKDDSGGAGLWPLAVHNQVVATLVRGAVPSTQNPADAFDVGRQQRFISLNDVLDPAELRSVSFFRTACVLPDSTMLAQGETLTVQEGDRLGTAPVMRELLVLALETLQREKVESVAVIEARIFDVDLAMIQMAERKARRKAMEAKAQGKRAGLTETAVAEKTDEARKWPPGSPQAELLKKTLTWRPDEWMTLNSSRRLFLYAQAKPLSPSPEATRARSSRRGWATST